MSPTDSGHGPLATVRDDMLDSRAGRPEPLVEA